MTQREFAKLDEKDLKNIAAMIAENITIRQYDEVGSHDETRKATKVEYDILFNLAYAAMIAYGYRSDGNLDSILDMTEFTLHRFIPQANSYDTLYIPLKKAMGVL